MHTSTHKYQIPNDMPKERKEDMTKIYMNEMKNYMNQFAKYAMYKLMSTQTTILVPHTMNTPIIRNQ